MTRSTSFPLWLLFGFFDGFGVWCFVGFYIVCSCFCVFSGREFGFGCLVLFACVVFRGFLLLLWLIGWCLVLVLFFFLPADDKSTPVELCPSLFPPAHFPSFSSVSSLCRVGSGGWTRTHVLVSLDIQMPAPPRRKLLQLYVQWNILSWWAYRHVTRDRTCGKHLNGTGFAYRLCFTLVMFFSLIRGGHI